MNKGVRTHLKLLLDARSARKLEREAQQALERGTDPREAKKNLREVGKETDSLAGTFKKLGGIIAGVFAVHQLKTYAAEMFKLGTAAEETGSKFQTTFGDAAKEVQAFIDDWGTMAGLNKTLAREFNATAGSIVQGMGASKDASADFSEQMLRLAGDLQSFHNVPIEQTFGAIKSGLVGSWEPLDRFGIVLRQADVDQRALVQTGKEHAQQLTQLEKAQAALSLMYERAGPALGDLARTQDSTANKTRALKTEFENLKIELAEDLLPTFSELVGWLSENKDSIANTADNAAESVVTIVEAVARLTNAVAKPIQIAIDIKTRVNGVEQDIRDYFQSIGWIRGINERLDEANRRALQNADLTDEQRRRIASSWGMSPPSEPAASGPPRPAGYSSGDRTTYSLQNLPPIRVPVAPEPASKDLDNARVQAEKILAEFGRTMREGLPAGLAGDTALTRELRAERKRRQDARKNFEGRGGTLERAGSTGYVPNQFIQPQAMEEISNFEMFYRETMGNIESVSHSAAAAITDSFGYAFELMIEHGATVGNLFEGLGRGMAASMLHGLAAFAEGKVAENIAWAIEKTALSLGFASLLSPGQAAASSASAGEHLAAAAAWGVLAGGANVGAGAASGRSVSRPSGSTDTSAARIQNTATKGPEVHIYIDPLDPGNPAYQRNVYAAQQSARERYGDNAHISVHPRSQ